MTNTASEWSQNLASEILHILNDETDFTQALQGVLTVIQKTTGFDAVGIRLRSGDDFPYFLQNGFSSDFLLKENTLVARNASGGICKDKTGKVCLECTCGLVISGQTNPASSLFTPGGSCWTNNSLPILDIPADQEPRLHPRNRCIHDGYLSIALIPLRSKKDIVGILQLNDRRENQLTIENVNFLERIGFIIGGTLMRKQSEEALRAKEEVLRAVVTNSMAVIFVIDKNGIFTLSEGSVLKKLGLESGQVVGQSVFDLYKDHPSIISAVKETLAGHSINHISHVNGVVFDTYYSPIKDDHGKVTSLVGIATDITEKVQAEKEKTKIQSQLLHSSKLASIGTLAAGVAHEINNPLTIVAGFVGILESKNKGHCTPEDLDLLHKIQAATTRITKIVKGLKSYAREDHDNIEDVDLHLCITETLSLVKGIYEKENIQIETALQAQHYLLPSNMGKMQQVLLNIIENARDALIGKKAGLIRIETQNKEGSILVTISDNGTGIPKHVLPQIFDPFFTTKDPGKGTGLGLSISHTIISAFKGTINVESAQGIGTSFKIHLPTSGAVSLTA